ncbi:mCG148229 [Mus musculus]|jgi:hypothetical protein|uniref:Uncharacterized protein n=1 Tax=Mus musculus TaxID=10090 RepID=Q9D179_MOUSE|nr:mCG148229 [Mus musculus]BAB23036.1 unnamed protein product [Mus musculus]
MTLSEKLTSAPHAETDLGMLFNHSLISSHEIAGEIFWPVTQGIWSPQLPLENISDCMVPITEMCFLTVQEAGKVKTKVAALPGLHMATIVLHPHMGAKDLSLSSLKPNPMASVRLSDFLIATLR